MGNAATPHSTPVVRHLNWGDVHIQVGTDAVAVVWTPNLPSDERLELDVLDDLAILVHLGLDQPAADPRWDEPNELVILAHIDLGKDGQAAIHGTPVGEGVLADLLGRGYVAAAQRGRQTGRV